jgi:GT2 family glycosyltransferase
MDISIIIVSWNVKEKLEKNLEAIYKNQGSFSFEIFVVDNNSSDGSVEMIKNDFSKVNLIVNDNNRGFAKANNQAIKKSIGDFVLLLNPDMQVRVDTLEKMLKWVSSNKQASVVGCHLVDEKNETIPHVRRFPTVWDQLVVILKIPHVLPSVLNKYLFTNFDYNKESKVDSIRGSFFMIRREMIEKIGGLDGRYFIWFEEVDYCKQVYKNGGEVWYTSATECVDYVGQSFEKVDVIKKQNYFCDSMLKYFKKWHSVWQYYILKIAWMFVLLLLRLGRIFKK